MMSGSVSSHSSRDFVFRHRRRAVCDFVTMCVTMQQNRKTIIVMEVFRLDGSMLTTAMQEKDLVLQAVLLQRSAHLQ